MYTCFAIFRDNTNLSVFSCISFEFETIKGKMVCVDGLEITGYEQVNFSSRRLQLLLNYAKINKSVNCLL